MLESMRTIIEYNISIMLYSSIVRLTQLTGMLLPNIYSAQTIDQPASFSHVVETLCLIFGSSCISSNSSYSVLLPL
jgi:hypothetical protein